MKTKVADNSLIDFGEIKVKKATPKARTAEEEAWDMLNSWIFIIIFFYKKNFLKFQFRLLLLFIFNFDGNLQFLHLPPPLPTICWLYVLEGKDCVIIGY